MDNFIKKLYNKYQGKVLEDDGAYKSKDFIKFASYMKRQFKASAQERGFELDAFSIGHYYVSGFFKKGDKFVYFSYDEPRHQQIDFNKNDPTNGFLYRTAEHNKDYTGGRNNFVPLSKLMDAVESMIA